MKEKSFEREFEEQERLEEATRWERIEERIRDGIGVDRYVDIVNEWRGGSVIYKAKTCRGFEDTFRGSVVTKRARSGVYKGFHRLSNRSHAKGIRGIRLQGTAEGLRFMGGR